MNAKTYLATFTGRQVGAIGIFYPCAVVVEGADEHAATLKLYDTHEHCQGLKLAEVPTASPFDAEGLALVIQNDRNRHAAFRSLLKSLVCGVDRAADYAAKANADWHDDEESEDHDAYHAPAELQFPRAVRREALLDLIRIHLETIDEADGVRGFWPEDFATLAPGDRVTLADGVPAVIEEAPHGKDNAHAVALYRMQPGGALARRSVAWKDIAGKEATKCRYTITTQSRLRAEFWGRHYEWSHLYRATKRQNDYPADVRTAWVDFVDAMHRDGAISDALAHRATL